MRKSRSVRGQEWCVNGRDQTQHKEDREWSGGLRIVLSLHSSFTVAVTFMLLRTTSCTTLKSYALPDHKFLVIPAPDLFLDSCAQPCEQPWHPHFT